MDKNALLPPQPDVVQLPESLSSSSSKSSFAISSNSVNIVSTIYRKYNRSKSLSNIAPDTYTAGEIRRIKERLLRTTSQLHPSEIRGFSRKQKITLLNLALVDFMCFCSMSIMAPFFPREATEKGLSDTLSGFVFSFYALVMFITSPIFGKILPRIGAKFLFLFGMFVAGICNILFGTLEYIEDYTLFTTFCLIVRGFEALGASAFSTASYVFVINSFPNNIGSVIGILETFVGLGMSTGPVVGGFLYSLGGFALPFYALGIAMIAIIPLNMWLLPVVDEDFDNVTDNKTSIMSLIKVPAVVVTGTVVVIVSSTWAFLDPTLEPHLRQFNLSAEKIGLIFLLFSGLYGISSPIWGWIADKANNHWSMMVIGLFSSSIGLLLLGPCPFIPNIPKALWVNLLALSILGISVALALMPTFQGVLNSAIHGGCSDSLATYSVVAGIWSCMYSLGEVIGPSLGGFLLQYYGFPISSTVMAIATFILGVITFFFFILYPIYCSDKELGSDSGISESWKTSDSSQENTPLLLCTIGSSYKSYTEDKIQYYGNSRKQEFEHEDRDTNQLTDVRGTITITSKGACEV